MKRIYLSVESEEGDGDGVEDGVGGEEPSDLISEAVDEKRIGSLVRRARGWRGMAHCLVWRLKKPAEDLDQSKTDLMSRANNTGRRHTAREEMGNGNSLQLRLVESFSCSIGSGIFLTRRRSSIGFTDLQLTSVPKSKAKVNVSRSLSVSLSSSLLFSL
jgi:hypothetical protein